MTEISVHTMVDLVYKSRATVLDMLRRRGYNTSSYDSYTIKDIETMLEDTGNQLPLDIRCSLTPEAAAVGERRSQVLVRYRFTEKLKNKLHNLFTPAVDTTGIVTEGGGGDDDAETITGGAAPARRRRAAAVEKHILDGFNPATDELILIVGEHVGEPFHKAATDAYNKWGTRVSIFYLPDLVVNRLNHVLVPPHMYVPRSEHETILKRLMVTSKSKLSAIRYHEDMIARMMGLYPGDIVEIHRPSRTAGVDKIFRHCV